MSSSSRNNNPYEDGEVARALQEEYEKEYRRRGLEQLLGASSDAGSLGFPPTTSYTNDVQPSAPSASEIFAQPFYSESAMESNNGHRIGVPEPVIPYTTPYMTQTTRTTSRPSQKPPRQQRQRKPRVEPRQSKGHHQDHLQNSTGMDQVDARPEQPRNQRERKSRTRESQDSKHIAGMDQLGVGFEVTPMEVSDEEIARRLQQELRDEELARQFVVQEVVTKDTTPRSSCGKFCHVMRRCFSCLLGTVLIAVAVVVVLYFLGILRGVPDFIPTPENFREEDPFNNANPRDANLWKAKGKGLSLVVINALDSKWDKFFYTAVDQWAAGSPSALKLSISQSYPETTCSTVDGRVKVCNGDYGATNWRGINKVLLHNDLIYASAARMNDYYVRDADAQQKQYTMCHELGHAWGLPHTDENFNNRDLRNCMDYTNNPENNMQPGPPNFEFLAQLYGTLDGSSILSDTGIYVTSRESIPGARRLESLPSSILKRVDEVDSLVDRGLINEETEGWRKLHSTKRGQAMSYSLGNGYVVQIHTLFV